MQFFFHLWDADTVSPQSLCLREETETVAVKMELELEPSPSRKKRCVGEEKRFQDKWNYDNFVVPHGSDKVMCLI